MTALRDIWLTTEDGDVVRADVVAGFNLKLVGGPVEPDPNRPPIDVELWIYVAHSDHQIRLVCEAAETVPSLLAGLITVLSEASQADSASLFVRPVPPSTPEGGIGSCWVVEQVAPTHRWRDFILG